MITHTSDPEYSCCILGLSSDEPPFSWELIAFDKSFLAVFQTHNLDLRYGQICWWGLTPQLSSKNTSDLEISQNSFGFRDSLSPYKFWSLTNETNPCSPVFYDHKNCIQKLNFLSWRKTTERNKFFFIMLQNFPLQPHRFSGKWLSIFI